MKKRMIIFLVLILFVSSGAEALINMDFQRDEDFTVTMTGAGPNGGFGGAGDVWNDITFTPPGWFYQDPCMVNLVDSTGSATGVDFTSTGVIGAYSVGWMGTNDLTPDGLYVWPGNDGSLPDGTPITSTDDVAWELSGLAPGGSYQMANYSSASTSYNLDMTIDTDGDGDLSDETPFTVVVDEFPAITSIIAGASGTIIGSATTSAGVSEGHWSGFQLIQDADPVGGISPTTLSLTEDPGGTPSDTYTITLTEQPPAGATFAVYLDPCDLWADGLEQVTVSPAKAGDPNTAVDITIDSANWAPVVVTLTAVNDAIGEMPVDLTLSHSLVLVSGSVSEETDPNWAGASLSPFAVAVDVADDDQRYAVTIDELDPCGIEVSEQGPTSDTFTVVIKKSPTNPITVDIATDGETSLSSNALVFNSGNWNVAQTVTVTAVDDTVGEADPHSGDITYSVDPGALTWNPLYSDDFENTTEDGWTTAFALDGEPNAVHDGSQLLVYDFTGAVAPGSYTGSYRVTVDCDFRGYTYANIMLRTDTLDYATNIFVGYYHGAQRLTCTINGTDLGAFGTPMPGWGVDPNVYRFTIEDFGDTITVRMENIANPSNFLELSKTGDYAGVGSGTKIILATDAVTSGAYIKFDNFEVESLAAGQDEKLEWLNAAVEVVNDLDGDAQIYDNDCNAERATQLGDLDDDCDVDLADFALMAEGWMDCVLPNVPGCI